jgi:hypothetical protein
MNINELMQLLKNANDKYNEDNDNYYNTDAIDLYKNFENMEGVNYEY